MKLREALGILAATMWLIFGFAVLTSACAHGGVLEVPSQPDGILPPCVDMGGPDGGEPGVFCPISRWNRVLDKLEAAQEAAAMCGERDGG